MSEISDKRKPNRYCRRCHGKGWYWYPKPDGTPERASCNCPDFTATQNRGRPRRDCKLCWGRGWVISQSPGRGRVKVQCKCLHPQSEKQRKAGALAGYIVRKVRREHESES